MCWACDNEQLRYDRNRCFSTYELGRVVADHKRWLPQLATEQRANLETARFYHFLCDRHLDHYEQVVQLLEKGMNNAKVEQ